MTHSVCLILREAFEMVPDVLSTVFGGLYTVYSDIKYFVHIPHCPVRIENTVSEGLTLCGCFSIFFDF